MHQADRIKHATRRGRDWLRWRGSIPTVLEGPAAGLRIRTCHASANYALGTNEPPVQRAIVGLLHPGDTFIDVGANVGFFSLLAARAVGPTGSVVAFEAVPHITAMMVDNVRLNGFVNVDVRTIAVGAAAGRAALNITHHPGGATIADEIDADDVARTVQTGVASLDALHRAGQLAVPHLIKIDVEGHEHACLLGMAELLRHEHPALLIELDASSGERLAAKQTRIGVLLAELGYRVEPLDPSYGETSWHVTHLLAKAA
jgi:FkbM family methyltransferase